MCLQNEKRKEILLNLGKQGSKTVFANGFGVGKIRGGKR